MAAGHASATRTGGGRASLASPFSPEVLAARLQRLQHEVKSRKLGAVVLANPTNSLYLTGFECSNSLIVVSSAAAYFLTDFRYMEQAARSLPAGYELVRMEQASATQVGVLLRRMRVRRCSTEESISVQQYRALSEAGPTTLAWGHGAGAVLRQMRMVKTPAETALIRANQHLTEDILAGALARGVAGVTEAEVRRRIRFAQLEVGADEAFESIVAAGPNSALPHARAGLAVVRAGKYLLTDLGTKRGHYHSDMTRTWAVGDAGLRSKRHREIYEIVKAAHEAAKAAVRAGIAAAEVDGAAREIIREAGYGEQFGHGLGHGVGLEIHEGPTLNPRSKDVLEAGMVVTIEPGIYIPGFGGVRIEDTVVVTAAGFDNMNRLSLDFQAV